MERFRTVDFLDDRDITSAPFVGTRNVEGAPVRLKGLTLAHPMASPDAIRGMILGHYTRQLLHATYKIPCGRNMPNLWWQN